MRAEVVDRRAQHLPGDLSGDLTRPEVLGTCCCGCIEACGRVVVRLGLAGPGSDLSEEPVSGCEPVPLESETLPECPPGPVAAPLLRSSSRARYTRSDRRLFEASHRFVGSLACRDLSVVVGPAFGGVAQLDPAMMCSKPVDLAVPAAGESVAHVVPRGGVDGGGAGPGREVALVREAVKSPTSTSSLAAPEGPMPCKVVGVVPVSRGRAVSSLYAAFLRR